jgi:hypothetical protein
MIIKLPLYNQYSVYNYALKNLDVFYDIFWCDDWISWFISLYSPHWDDSNDGKYISIGLIMSELWYF